MTIYFNRTVPLLFALALTLVSGLANADIHPGTPGLWDAYQSQQDTLQSFRAGNLEAPVQKALNILVARGLKLLAASGETELSLSLGAEWNSRFSNYLPSLVMADPNHLGNLTILDLGDHDVLSPWLARFHQTLSEKTKGIVDGFQIIRDISDMNYALMVVMHPTSRSWKSFESELADEWEYRKHFIPMSNIITYWTSLEACNYATRTLPVIRHFCSPAADKLKFLMGRYWAAKMSDWVYEKANGKRIAHSVGAHFNEMGLSEASFEAEVLHSTL